MPIIEYGLKPLVSAVQVHYLQETAELFLFFFLFPLNELILFYLHLLLNDCNLQISVPRSQLASLAYVSLSYLIITFQVFLSFTSLPTLSPQLDTYLIHNVSQFWWHGFATLTRLMLNTSGILFLLTITIRFQWCLIISHKTTADTASIRNTTDVT